MPLLLSCIPPVIFAALATIAGLITGTTDNTNTNDNTTAKTFFVIFFINKVPHFLNCNILCRLLYIDFLLL